MGKQQSKFKLRHKGNRPRIKQERANSDPQLSSRERSHSMSNTQGTLAHEYEDVEDDMSCEYEFEFKPAVEYEAVDELAYRQPVQLTSTSSPRAIRVGPLPRTPSPPVSLTEAPTPSMSHVDIISYTNSVLDDDDYDDDDCSTDDNLHPHLARIRRGLHQADRPTLVSAVADVVNTLSALFASGHYENLVSTVDQNAKTTYNGLVNEDYYEIEDNVNTISTAPSRPNQQPVQPTLPSQPPVFTASPTAANNESTPETSTHNEPNSDVVEMRPSKMNINYTYNISFQSGTINFPGAPGIQCGQGNVMKMSLKPPPLADCDYTDNSENYYVQTQPTASRQQTPITTDL